MQADDRRALRPAIGSELQYDTPTTRVLQPGGEREGERDERGKREERKVDLREGREGKIHSLEERRRRGFERYWRRGGVSVLQRTEKRLWERGEFCFLKKKSEEDT